MPSPLLAFLAQGPPPAAADSLQSADTLTGDLTYIALLFALFVVPKALQRYRIPSAVTSLGMGVAANALGWIAPTHTLILLSTFGIVALFLFAGLDIDAHELRSGTRLLVQHGVLWSLLVVVATVALQRILNLGVRPAVLTALALMTPSAGFILSSLNELGVTGAERFGIKTTVVASEMLALAALFIVLRSTSAQDLLLATLAMGAIVLIIPLAFRAFAAGVAPYAPRSEFAFLLMVGVVCAYTTRRLGVYYLVGAFLVGVAAQRFRATLPAMSSEKMVDALEAFGSVFIPFYFFVAGVEIRYESMTWSALWLGLAMCAICLPLRVGAIILHRKVAIGGSIRSASTVGLALAPTLVFTLVLSEIASDYFALPAWIGGGLVVYAIINTSMPAFFLRGPVPDYETVAALDVSEDAPTQPVGLRQLFERAEHGLHSKEEAQGNHGP